MSKEPVLQYSCCNEDTQSEIDAMALNGKRVLSIAAAGERAFGLLLGDPREVVAIDRNPAQIHLATLKLAAMRMLERDAYLEFVGIRGSGGRTATFRSLRETLPSGTRMYWDARRNEIERGILHIGRCERSLARVAPVFRRMFADDIERIRASETLEEQAKVVRRLFARPSVRAILALVFNPIAGRYLLRDPVYYGEGRRAAATYLRERLLTTLERHRFDDCFILSLFLYGHLERSAALPVDLTEEGYPIVRSRLSRIRFETECINAYLAKQPDATFDAFSLSDLGGYMSSVQFTVLLDHMQRVSTDDATVCIREFISRPTERALWPGALMRAPSLEAKLAETDRSVGCTFVCASRVSRASTEPTVRVRQVSTEAAYAEAP